MTLYSADSFDWADTAHTVNRADSTTSLGSTDGAGTLDPLTWTARAGTWGISSHQAYTAVTAATAIATVDLGTADVDISLVTSVRSSANGAGIVFRYTSLTDYWYVRNNSSNNTQLFRHTSGGDAQLGSNISGAADGDTLRVIAAGPNIDVYRNGVLKISVTGQPSTATLHGLENSTGSANRLDSWSASSPAIQHADLADTVGITDTFARIARHPRSLSDVVGITDALKIKYNLRLLDTVGITAAFSYGIHSHQAMPSNAVGITAMLGVTGVLVQFDTWRPIAKPDNTCILVCRTPVGEHDSYTGLTHLELWTILPDGTEEHPAIRSPAINGYGWDSFSHPEWSPTGDSIVLAAETATEYRLVALDTSGFRTQ